ncbi:hypothetical protein U9R90_26800 [Streptomyces sp. E11-3]|uniref:hypothetical protein n=1 Tax=Streptomyces sp. E11-3 TaxID=3110112 RepID=UPI00397FDD37
MSTPPETPSPRSIAREVTGLLLVAAGALVVLVALGTVHPLLSTGAAAVGTVIAFRPAPPRSTVSRIVACVVSTIVAGVAVGCAFTYFPPLGWVEVGAGLIAAGVWLASEGA